MSFPLLIWFGLRNKPFHYYGSLLLVFGKDHAIRARVIGPAKALEELEAEDETKDGFYETEAT